MNILPREILKRKNALLNTVVHPEMQNFMKIDQMKFFKTPWNFLNNCVRLNVPLDA